MHAFLLRNWFVLVVLAHFPRAHAQVSCVNGMAGPYPCSNVDLMATMSVTQLGSTINAADIWGWTDPLTQKEYAIVALRTGTAFVDLSVPTAPVLTGFLPSHIASGNTLWRDVDVSGNWCYVGSETAGHGLQVFDLTRLRSVVAPPQTFTEDAWTGIIGNSHTVFADKASPYVYAVGTTSINNGGLTVFNVSDPLAPTLVGTYTDDGYVHENMVITYNGPDLAHVGQQLSFNFHPNGTDRFTIVDVTDKSDMQRISTTTYAQGSICHQGWVTADHRFLLIDDEGDEAAFGTNTRTRIFSIEDLELPQLIGTYTGPVASVDHNLYIANGLVYEANYTSGLRILDARDVALGSLAQSAWFDTYPATNNATYDGAWGNYPFFPSGLVVVSGYAEGLFVLRPRTSVRLKVFLEGPFDALQGIMHDSLRVKGLLPLGEPYTGLGYVHAGGGGGESTNTMVLAQSGQNAIVDWVVVELRDATMPATVLATRSALLQRDGDVVGMDGASPVQFSLPVGSYHIAVRHRNHLGVMTADAVPVSIAERSYDLSNGSQALFGSAPAKAVGAVNVLWAGNVLRDAALRYTNASNDREPILSAIGGVVPTATVTGYLPGDTNLDGSVRYTGSANDRDPILQNIGGVVPTNTRTEQVP